MSEYLLGLATLPFVAVGGYLLMHLLAQLVRLLGRFSLGTAHRIRPDAPGLVAQRRAAVVFGLRRGFVWSLGEFVLVVGTDLDDERRRWAHQRLARRLTRKAGESDGE